jgi:hypothetical protein
MFTFVPSGTGSPNAGTIFKDSLGNLYYREQHLGPLNILWFGGFSSGSSDNTSALNSALAALPSGGGEIFFPPGKYQFDNMITYTIPSGPFSVSFVGAGADVTTLYWPSTSGITVNASSPSHSVHFRDLSITTGTAGGNYGIQLNNSVPLGNFAQSDLVRMTFRGDYSGSDCYWTYAVAVSGLCNIAYDTLLIYGYNQNGGGISLQGNSSESPYFSIVHNISKCGFFALQIGLLYGQYVQGVTVSQCNFTNGSTGISVPAGIPSAEGPSQLAISNSQFNCSENQVYIQSPISGLYVTGNNLYIPTTFNGFQFTATGNLATFQGNTFSGTAGSPSATGIGVGALFFNSTVIGNVFNSLNVGVNLTDAYGWNVQANVYQSVTTKTINGTGNSVGVATP